MVKGAPNKAVIRISDLEIYSSTTGPVTEHSVNAEIDQIDQHGIDSDRIADRSLHTFTI
jgi:hypothetical protein